MLDIREGRGFCRVRVGGSSISSCIVFCPDFLLVVLDSVSYTAGRVRKRNDEETLERIIIQTLEN